jgi:hypothetical protein
MRSIWNRYKLWITIAFIFILAFIVGAIMTLDVAAPVLKSVGFGPEGPIDGQ